ncbi:hypothetical protein [Ralstonia pseudosolanacearum]|uniref:hypothetical protein n=1 Tax=Ralstonia pseudosolanacearum TaxID=1310165 RepID=UPI001FF7AB9C|nr:hypothetical protein [Ralstonia pseudosolanacearum]
MSHAVPQRDHLLDRIYGKVAAVISRVHAGAASHPTKTRRGLVVIGLAIALLAASELVIGPMLTELNDSFAWSEYNGKFKAANEKAISPVEKSALLLLSSCMRRNQFAPKRNAQYLMLDQAEQLCLGQAISQVMLSGGEDKGREVATIYERLGFKLDPKLSRVLGL